MIGSPEEEPSVPPRRDWLGLALLTALALALRLPGIGADLWIDEIATVQSFVRLSIPEILTSYQANNHVLYSLLAHVSVAVLGENPVAVRLPALIFGVASVPLLYWLARTWFGRLEAGSAALLLAVSYHHAYFSQNGRGYTGFVFLTILTTGLLARGLRPGRGGGSWWWSWVVATAANVLIYLSGVFVAASQVAGALYGTISGTRPGGQRRATRWRIVGYAAAAAGLTLVVHLPLLASMVEFFTTAEANAGWLPSRELVRVFVTDLVPSGGGAAVALALVVLPVAVAGVGSLVRRAPLLLFAFVIPPVIEFVVGLSLGAGTYPRRFLIVLPFGILTVVRGAAVVAALLKDLVGGSRLVSRSAFGALVGGTAVIFVLGIPRLHEMPKQDFTGALEYVEERRQAGEVLAGAYITDSAARYYDDSVRSARTSDRLESLLEEHETIWLLGTLVQDMRTRAPDLYELIAERFCEEARFPGLVGDGTIVVWRSAPTPAAASGTPAGIRSCSGDATSGWTQGGRGREADSYIPVSPRVGVVARKAPGLRLEGHGGPGSVIR